MSSKPILSVICPIYNSEEYLDSLFSSIKQQTFSNFEIIFINDGSKDKSLDKLIKFKEENINIRVRIFNQTNKGPSSARNNGIENAQGKYILFIDSDDFFSKNFFEEMIDGVLQNKADLVICGFERIKESGKKIIKKIIERKEDINSSVWNKLFIKKIILDNKIHFDEQLTQEEDLKFVYEYLFYIKRKISFINEILYFAVRHNISLSRSFKPSFIKCIKIDSNLKKLYKKSEYYKKIEIMLYRRNISRLVWIIQDKDREQRIDFYNRLKENITKNYRDISKNPFYSITDKISSFIFLNKGIYTSFFINWIMNFFLYKIKLFHNVSKIYFSISKK